MLNKLTDIIRIIIQVKSLFSSLLKKTEALQMLRSPEVHLLCWMQKLYEL